MDIFVLCVCKLFVEEFVIYFAVVAVCVFNVIASVFCWRTPVLSSTVCVCYVCDRNVS